MNATGPTPDELREWILDAWEQASPGWGRQADPIQAFGRPVSDWMVDHLGLAAGQQVLELAAGPGDTGFLAAARIRPGGTLVTSDASAGMLELARARAAGQGVENVDFRQLQLEWIDLPTAAVDRILCRWGIMLLVDPDAALRECRRVLRPGGRICLAVWDAAEVNPWDTIPKTALVALGHVDPPPAGGPGMFALADPGALAGHLTAAGFVEPIVEPVAVSRSYDSVDGFLDETNDRSVVFATAWRRLDGAQREALTAEVARRAQPFTSPDGSLTLPGRSLAAVAEA